METCDLYRRLLIIPKCIVTVKCSEINLITKIYVVFHVRFDDIVTPTYFGLSTCSNTWPCKM